MTLQELIDVISDNINQNGKGDISGLKLQEVLVSMAEFSENVKPIKKQEGMTQEVGVDLDGKLYTYPSTGFIDAEGYDLKLID